MLVAETERLLLHRFTPADAAFVFELVNEPSWRQYIGDRGVHNLDDARAYLANGPIAMYGQLGFGLYRIDRKEDRAPVGICGLLRRFGLDDVDLGFALLSRFTGRGYAREAARAIVGHGFDELHLRRIVAITSPDNGASIRLLESLGFASEGMLKLAGHAAPVRLFACDESFRPATAP